MRRARRRSKRPWSVAFAHGRLYAGVEPAGLFVSHDSGERASSRWQGLRDHPTRPDWQPGGAGLILHSMALDPDDPRRLWVGDLGGWSFHSGDGGETWAARTTVPAPTSCRRPSDIPSLASACTAWCKAPGAASGSISRTTAACTAVTTAARTGMCVEAGPAVHFGFPAAAHPRDPEALFLVPLNGARAGRLVPDGRAAVWKRATAAQRWRGGAPACRKATPSAACCARRWRPTALEPAGVYFGAGTGALYASADEGEAWTASSRICRRSSRSKRWWSRRDDSTRRPRAGAGALAGVTDGAVSWRASASSNCRLEAWSELIRRARCALAGHARSVVRFVAGGASARQRFRQWRARRGSTASRRRAPMFTS